MKYTLAFAVALSLAATAAQAAPYASQVSVSSLAVSPGAGLTVSYVLNEGADAVTVEVLDGVTVVATFAGTATQGENNVVWDGTNNNAGGTAVGGGTYTVRVRANKNVAGTAWREIASQRSLGAFGPAGATYNQVWDGFSPNDMRFVLDQSSDHFGKGYAFNSLAGATGVGVAAGIPFRADAAVLDGTDGLASRIFRNSDIDAGATGAGSYWGTSVDPDNPEAFYITGQDANATAGTNFMYADLGSPANSVTADSADHLKSPTNFNARGVAVTKEGATKYAYFTYGNSTIGKAEINGSNQLVAPPVAITGTFAVTTRYSKDVSVDAAGNLYYLTKTAPGAIYRWNAAQIAGAPPLATPLTEANAVWNVEAGTGMTNMMGPAITPAGDVYVAFQSGTAEGIYYVGNTATASIVKTLSAADLVVDTKVIGSPSADWNPSSIYFNIRSDAAGNVVALDRSTEQIRIFSAPGNTSIETAAPTSQTFQVTSNVANWELY